MERTLMEIKKQECSLVAAVKLVGPIIAKYDLVWLLRVHTCFFPSCSQMSEATRLRINGYDFHVHISHVYSLVL